MPWDLERFFWGNPNLTKTERSVAVQILRSWDRRFWPVDGQLASQTLIGHWVGCWRSTACRALRKMITLGYFRTTWRTVKKQTRQGWKGVTRVQVRPGPELLKLICPDKPDVCAAQGHPASVCPGQARCVTPSHTSRTHQARPGTVGGPAIANSADRNGEPSADTAEFRRKTLANWPRLAGGKPISADRLPSAVPYAELELDRRDGAELGDLDADEYAARVEASKRQLARRLQAELEAREQRNQPRRRPPRSRR